MHYTNGRAAKVGDLVRGKGYNLKYEFTGILMSAQPDVSACNCTVTTMSHRVDTKQKMLLPDLEYGQLDAFVAIDPETGEVLPAEVVATGTGPRALKVVGDTSLSATVADKVTGAIAAVNSNWTAADKELLGKVEDALHDESKAKELATELPVIEK